MDNLLQFLSENKPASFVAGMIIAFYITGEIEERLNPLPMQGVDMDRGSMSVDEERKFHENRLQVLDMLDKENLSMDELVLQLRDTIQSMQSEIDELKGQVTHA